MLTGTDECGALELVTRNIFTVNFFHTIVLSKIMYSLYRKIPLLLFHSRRCPNDQHLTHPLSHLLSRLMSPSSYSYYYIDKVCLVDKCYVSCLWFYIYICCYRENCFFKLFVESTYFFSRSLKMTFFIVYFYLFINRPSEGSANYAQD
jgi:hypothetical protein